MTQDAVVIRNLSNCLAEVAVTRGTACGSNCENCEACIYANEIHAIASNKINAQPGQHVLLESSSSKIFKAEFFVYILPMILMIVGYLVAYLLGASEIICVIVCFSFLVVSALVLVKTQRGKHDITHTIIKIKEV